MDAGCKYSVIGARDEPKVRRPLTVTLKKGAEEQNEKESVKFVGYGCLSELGIFDVGGGPR